MAYGQAANANSTTLILEASADNAIRLVQQLNAELERLARNRWLVTAAIESTLPEVAGIPLPAPRVRLSLNLYI